jgi:MFS transporter, AAHS family, 4-hydroxybenzoate transporter
MTLAQEDGGGAWKRALCRPIRGLAKGRMMAPQMVDIAELLETRPLGRFHILAATLGFLALFVDGLDFSAGMVGAPAILRAFHAERGEMGMVFGAGSVGALLGALIFGTIADRFGRKLGIILGVLCYSLSALGSAFAGSLDELMVLRFVTGLGVGGVVANTIALLTETAPRRYRASFIMLTLIGIAAGNAAAGQVAARLIPGFGWPVVFEAGGLVGLALTVILIFFLPESIRYLAVTDPDSPALRRLVARIAGDRVIPPDAKFFLHQPQQRGVALKQLFTGLQKIATPLLWIGYFFEALTFLTLLSWFAVFLESAGLPPTEAAFAFSYGGMGGICAILVMSRILDRFGPMALVASALAAIASLVLLGTEGLSSTTIVALSICAVAFCTATHNALNGTVGIFYPTAIRGKGVGYATGMGRIGLIVGPVATGFLLSAKLPLKEVLSFVAAPYAVVAITSGALGWLYQRHFSGGASIETAGPSVVPDAPPAAPIPARPR